MHRDITSFCTQQNSEYELRKEMKQVLCINSVFDLQKHMLYVSLRPSFHLFLITLHI